MGGGGCVCHTSAQKAPRNCCDTPSPLDYVHPAVTQHTRPDRLTRSRIFYTRLPEKVGDILMNRLLLYVAPAEFIVGSVINYRAPSAVSFINFIQIMNNYLTAPTVAHRTLDNVSEWADAYDTHTQGGTRRVVLLFSFVLYGFLLLLLCWRHQMNYDNAGRNGVSSPKWQTCWLCCGCAAWWANRVEARRVCAFLSKAFNAAHMALTTWLEIAFFLREQVGYCLAGSWQKFEGIIVLRIRRSNYWQFWMDGKSATFL